MNTLIAALSLLLPSEAPFQLVPLNENQVVPQEQAYYKDKTGDFRSFGSTVGAFEGESHQRYVYRFFKEQHYKHFNWDVKVSIATHKLGISPEVISYDESCYGMILEYIPSVKWPSYEEDSTPYQACIHALRRFHVLGKDYIAPFIHECSNAPYFPFSYISAQSKKIEEENIPVPKQLWDAINKVDLIFNTLRPWMDTNRIICHHDFHPANCILSQDKVYIIDWTTTAPLGDPFHDVESFVSPLQQDQKQELLCAYLGKSTLSESEKSHFRLIELVAKVRIAVVCFLASKDATYQEESIRNKLIEEMEDLLDSKILSGTSFLSVPYSRDSKKLRQRALLALQEFIDGSDEIPLLLEQFKYAEIIQLLISNELSLHSNK